MFEKHGITNEDQRDDIEKQLATRGPDAVDDLTPEEIVELDRSFRLSTPIRIPLDKLDPNYVYHWINKATKNFRRRRGLGWKTVNKEWLKKLSKVPIDELNMGTHFSPGDDILCIGDDLVFACMVKSRADVILKARQDQNRARLNAHKKQFHDAGLLEEVGTFETDGRH